MICDLNSVNNSTICKKIIALCFSKTMIIQMKITYFFSKRLDDV